MPNKIFMDCEFKDIGDSMTFSAYGNVKHVVDHVRDVAVDGCYTDSIKAMKAKNRYARLLWSHDPYKPPVGKINHMEEDSKGLFFEGKLSKTPRGQEMYVLAKDGAIDSFSIGYGVVDQEYDATKDINYLKQIDVREISFVNFACNEPSLLQDIKTQLSDGGLPTVRELEKALRESGFSQREAKAIVSCYKPKDENELDFSTLKSHSFFK